MDRLSKDPRISRVRYCQNPGSVPLFLGFGDPKIDPTKTRHPTRAAVVGESLKELCPL